MRDLTRDEASERQPVARVESAGPGPSPILALQNSAGNAAVARLLAPPAVPPPATGQLPALPPPGVGAAPEVAVPPQSTLNGVAPIAPSVAMPLGSTGPQQDFLATLAAAQANAVQRLTAAADAEIAALQTTLASQRQSVDQSLETALGQVREASSTARGQVTADVAATDASLDPAVAGERARLETWNQTAVADAGTALRERQDRVTTAAAERATTARSAATQAAEQSVAEANSQAEQASAIGQAKASTVSGDEEEVRSAQSAVSNDLARESATRITEGATEAAGVLRGQGEEVAGSLQTLGTNVSDDLGTHLGGIVDHIGQQAAGTVSTLDTSATQARSSLASQRDAAVSQIDRGEQDATTALRQEAVRRHSALDSAAEQAAEQLRMSVADAAQQSDAAVAQAAQLAMSQPLSPQDAVELGDSVCRQLETGFEPAMTGLSEHSTAIQDGLGTMSSDATASLTDAAGQTETGLRDTADQGSASARQVGEQATASFTSTVDQSTAAGDTAVASFAGSLDEHVTSAIPGFDDLLQQHEDSLTSQVADVRSRTSEPTGSLEDRIDTAQERARERAERSWLANQLADLWETVTSPEFLIGLAVGLAVGAIIILSAGTATPFVIMAAGIAAGAAGAAAGTMVGNYRAGRDLTENLFRNTLYGALAGGVGAGVYLFGTGLVAGLGLTGGAAVAGGFIVLELSAIASNTVMNLLAGDPWDKNLLTAMLLAPLIEIIQARLFGPKAPVPGEERPPAPGDGPNPEDGPAPRDPDRPTPTDEDGPAPRRPGEADGPEGVTDEDVHIEDGNEPARDPADPEVDPAICFAAGTLVSTPNGHRPIEELATGDVVHAYDHETKQVVPRTVIGTTRGSTTTWAEVRLRHKVIRSTLIHRFWVESLEEWVPAVDLKPGMTVLLVDGSTAEIDGVEQVSVPDKETTYNLSVDETENYFVGEDGVLVHNITRSRLARLSRPGYRNYVLRNRAGQIYYSGMFGPGSSAADVQARHRANHNRFNPARGDRFELLPGTREYGASRLLEHRTAVANDTIIGRDGDNYRGNRQDPLSEDSMPEYLEYEQVKRGCG